MTESAYTWKLDISKATQLSHSTQRKYFESPIFKMHGFKWNLAFCPNFKGKGYVQIALYLLSLPPVASKINVKRTCQVLETNTYYSITEQFSKGDLNSGWTNSVLKSKAIQNITRFTVVLGITLLDVFDSNGKDISEQYINPTEQKLQAPLSINDNKYEE
eukprot:422423_1